MADFTFVTSNKHKVEIARAVCDKHGLTFDHHHLDLVEIQASSGEEIALDKARQVYKHLDRPVVITDDSWNMPGLKGFPGPYMKYVSQWFTPRDFINLTQNLEDRRIFMRQVVAYKDGETEKVFPVDIEGVLLKETRGNHTVTHFNIVSFDGGKHSMAETGIAVVSDLPTAWHHLADWLQRR